jgi:hypothetical protein
VLNSRCKTTSERAVLTLRRPRVLARMPSRLLCRSARLIASRCTSRWARPHTSPHPFWFTRLLNTRRDTRNVFFVKHYTEIMCAERKQRHAAGRHAAGRHTRTHAHTHAPPVRAACGRLAEAHGLDHGHGLRHGVLAQQHHHSSSAAQRSKMRSDAIRIGQQKSSLVLQL